MRLPLIFSLLISMSTFAEEKSTVVAGEHSIKPFEDLTTQLFHTPRIWEWNIDYEIETLFKPMKPMMTWQMNKSFSEGLGKLKELAEK